jgi:bifunctional UDP-N-acetylglucosamine pyrophosphorylase/glucosamine-1-phosphate N-acetyltransferase
MRAQPLSLSDQETRTCLAIILAAGEGTRMRSALPKVLHRIAGRSMLAHVLTAVQEAGATRVEVVVGPGRGDVANEAISLIPHAKTVEQRERLGTAHAVLQAREALREGLADVVVAYADTPLVSAATFARLRRPLADGAAVAVLGFEAADPTGYGRLLVEDGRLLAIREEREANETERAVTLCNAGLMALRGDVALRLLESIGNANAKGEYYLTDAVEAAVAAGERAVVVTAPEAEVVGVNDRVQLAVAERLMQERLRIAAMTGGVTLVDPATVHLAVDTGFGRDVVVEPHVVFGPGVTIGDDVTIRAFSHLEGAEVGSGAIVGPFARLRPGARLGQDVHVGNFVEVKNANLAQGVKANHLAYLGDAEIGARTNVGAGTITCNYDGLRKHKTVIGEGVFVGTNSSLVAPVSIGDGAYIGSGSVITDDVPAQALAIGRGRQVVKEGWAKGKTKAG